MCLPLCSFWRLATHLENIEFDVSLVTTEWFLCLFAKSLPSEVLLKAKYSCWSDHMRDVAGQSSTCAHAISNWKFSSHSWIHFFHDLFLMLILGYWLLCWVVTPLLKDTAPKSHGWSLIGFFQMLMNLLYSLSKMLILENVPSQMCKLHLMIQL